MATACEGHSLSFQQVRNKCHIWLNLSHLIQAFPLLLSCVSRIWQSKNGILLLSSGFAPTVPVNRHLPGWFRVDPPPAKHQLCCLESDMVWFSLSAVNWLCLQIYGSVLPTYQNVICPQFLQKGKMHVSAHKDYLFREHSGQGTSLYWDCCESVTFKRILYRGWWLRGAAAA